MEKNQEIWKILIEFPYYEISNKGNIWSNKSNNFLNIPLPLNFAFFKKAQAFCLQTVQSNP